MTRQRVRPSLYQSLTEPCSHCGGTGRVFRPETVVRRIERAIRRIAAQNAEKEITIRVHPQVALYILEEEPDFLRRLEKVLRLDVDLRDDPLMRQDEFRLLAGRSESDVTGRYAIG
jgi:ribonuclease G